MDPYSEKAFRIVLVGGSLMAAFCLLCAMLSITLTDWAKSDVYVDEKISGTGDWSTRHEGRLSEASGGRNATLAYKYDKTVDESGSHKQNVELMMSGGDGSYWNYQRIWTDGMVAGSQSVDIRVGQIEGSYYGKNGMVISYNEANESREEFASTTSIDSRDGSASMNFDVIQWHGQGSPIPQFDEETGNFTGYAGGGSVGKPVSISELDMVGKFLVEQIVRLQEPVTDNKGWLEFCDSLDDKLPDGYMVLPSDLKYDWQNGTAWDYQNGTSYLLDK